MSESQCEPCAGTGKGFIVHPDREKDVVPCWHCGGTGRAPVPDVAERIAQAIEADQERDARWTVYSLGVSNGLRRAAAIAREHKETQQLDGGK